jgi:hypothetical protein
MVVTSLESQLSLHRDTATARCTVVSCISPHLWRCWAASRMVRGAKVVLPATMHNSALCHTVLITSTRSDHELTMTQLGACDARLPAWGSQHAAGCRRIRSGLCGGDSRSRSGVGSADGRNRWGARGGPGCRCHWTKARHAAQQLSADSWLRGVLLEPWRLCGPVCRPLRDRPGGGSGSATCSGT